SRVDGNDVAIDFDRRLERGNIVCLTEIVCGAHHQANEEAFRWRTSVRCIVEDNAKRIVVTRFFRRDQCELTGVRAVEVCRKLDLTSVPSALVFALAFRNLVGGDGLSRIAKLAEVGNTPDFSPGNGAYACGWEIGLGEIAPFELLNSTDIHTRAGGCER